MTNHSVDILMATYNGEKYVQSQLYSIMAQTYRNWRLLVHDDGSTDGTLEILRKFASIDSRIKVVEDGKVGLGPGRNFMHLLQFSGAPFICFADQDDIWFENKLSTLIGLISGKHSGKPHMVCCNFLVWEAGGVIKTNKLLNYHSIRDVLFQNGGLQGCACLFNRALLNEVDRSFRFIAMHDHLLTLVAMVRGEISYYDSPLFFYRRHSYNVTLFDRSIKNKIMQRSVVVDRMYYDGIVAFFEQFSRELTEKDKTLFEEFIKLPEKSKYYRFKSIIRYKFKLSKSTLRLLLKTLLCKFI